MRTTDENNNTFDKVFTVLVTPRQPIVITVDNTGDTHQTGHTTLRDAIAIANLDYVGDTINFASGLSGTITLTRRRTCHTAPMTINGPGAPLLAVSGNNSSRIFDIDDTNPFNPPSSKAVTITGLTLTKGNGTGNECEWIRQVAMFNAAQLILVNDTIKGNVGTIGGGLENTGGVV